MVKKAKEFDRVISKYTQKQLKNKYLVVLSLAILNLIIFTAISSAKNLLDNRKQNYTNPPQDNSINYNQSETTEIKTTTASPETINTIPVKFTPANTGKPSITVQPSNISYVLLPLVLGYAVRCLDDKVQLVDKAQNDYATTHNEYIDHLGDPSCEPCKDCGSESGNCYDQSSNCSQPVYDEKNRCISQCNSGPDANFASEADGDKRLTMMNRFYSCTSNCETAKDTALSQCEQQRSTCLLNAREEYSRKVSAHDQVCKDRNAQNSTERNRLDQEKDKRYGELIQLIGQYCIK